jgi:eukaryotic-like serine/threonine-protein kinase
MESEPGAVATVFPESQESLERPESNEPDSAGSVASASADAPIDGSQSEQSSQSDSEDDDQPTLLYTNEEFQRLSGSLDSPDAKDAQNSANSANLENSGNFDIEDVPNDLPSAPDWLKGGALKTEAAVTEVAVTEASGPLPEEAPVITSETASEIPSEAPIETPSEAPVETQIETTSQTPAESPGETDVAESPSEARVEPANETPAETVAELTPVTGAVTGEEIPLNEQREEGDTAGRKKSSRQAQVLTEGALLNSRYEIVRKIGGGGMGAVYLASDRNLGGVLRAVKEMVQTHIEPELQEKALADFKRESLLLSALEHPCIPTIYDYFYDDTACRFYLVMKYISGGDLAARLRSTPEGKIDEKSVTEWAAQTADVLDYLHSRQPPIVYRDLKPSNLMIDGNTGRIMLVDFGIARWVTKDEKGVTAVGTMGYAPPELFSGNVEPRSDIYSLGATMFHLLTGADPQSNPLLIFDFSKNPRPRQVNPNISNEMERILMRAVEYSVELRYNSASELREALMTHLERVRYSQLTYGPPQAGPPAGMTTGNLVFCGFCGEKIFVSDVFCPYCGAKQAVADQQQAGQQSPPQHQSQQNVRQMATFVQQQVKEQYQPKALARVTVLGTGELNPPTYRLEKESNVVGRRDPQTNIFPEVDLSKYDPQTKISRRHARIWKEGEKFLVEDLGSSNGTVVVSSMNEAIRLLPHQPQVLVNNSKLVIGDTTLQFAEG